MHKYLCLLGVLTALALVVGCDQDNSGVAGAANPASAGASGDAVPTAPAGQELERRLTIGNGLTFGNVRLTFVGIEAGRPQMYFSREGRNMWTGRFELPDGRISVVYEVQNLSEVVILEVPGGMMGPTFLVDTGQARDEFGNRWAHRIGEGLPPPFRLMPGETARRFRVLNYPPPIDAAQAFEVPMKVATSPRGDWQELTLSFTRDQIDEARRRAEQEAAEARRRAEQEAAEARRRAEQIAAEAQASQRASAEQLRHQAPGMNVQGTIFTNSVGMRLAAIPAGEYMRGSPANEAGRQDNETQHRVRLSRSFLLGVHPVTQAQWRAVMGNNPSRFGGNDNHPVENVSWHEAVEFCRRLTERDRAAGRIGPTQSYRLPTEAEWEYACRGGTTTAYYTGNDEAALGRAGWYSGNSNNRTQAVGQKVANAWGLYDMHGNVWEWCSDWYAGAYPAGVAVDPTGPANGTSRILRGGSWYNNPRSCRAASRSYDSPDRRGNRGGFRVSLDFP